MSKPVRACVGALLLLKCACHTNTQVNGVRTEHPQERKAEVPQVAWTVEFTGSGLESPRVFSYQQLAEMNMVLLDNVLLEMSHFPDERGSWRGPSVDALLKDARIKPGPMRFTLEGADGYRVYATREELQGAILALQDGEGRWLAEVGNQRPVRLVVPRRPGNYWVRNLSRIAVEPAGDGGPGS